MSKSIKRKQMSFCETMLSVPCKSKHAKEVDNFIKDNYEVAYGLYLSDLCKYEKI